jgi:hypothetical protein
MTDVPNAGAVGAIRKICLSEGQLVGANGAGKE